jgi:hypothetical protein
MWHRTRAVEQILNNLDTRTGWPEDLRVLLKEHPRSIWRARGSATTEFWLLQHDSFRRQCAALQAATDEFRTGARSASEFCLWVAPRLQGFIAHLHGHHQVEDFHYFPAFRAAEQRLAAGFDALAGDHALIHSGVESLLTAVNEFVAAVRHDAPSRDSQRHAGDRYVTASELLYKRLLRHLDDEEDLVIPVMLAQGH